MIKILDKNVADKIAAGEVIDRPVSIVKELVENSLDAEASSITVEIRSGGKEYLRVTDNGCGIPGEETSTAFLRHATSKIETESDLDAIRSLGFRGEALASIAAVARVDMITKTRDAHAGRHLVCEGSEILTDTPTGCPDGTTITVKDLFYNVPARKKFLGTDGAEARRVIDLMSRIALAYPDVRFRLRNGSQDVFQTAGRGSILDNISRIYGRDLSKDLVPVDFSRDDFLVRGFVSSPGTSVTSRSRQFFCVNGRVVSSATMQRGLEKGYRERLFAGRFPIAFLFLQLPADQLDVNVHPTKKEVRFDDEFAVEDFLTEAVTAALTQKQAIPDTAPSRPEKKETVQEKSEQLDIKNVLQTMRAASELREHDITETFEPEPASKAESSSEAKFSSKVEDAPIKASDISASSTERSRRNTLNIEDLTVAGVVFQTYIIATEGDTMYLIDQHAAHERIFYEQLLAQYHAQEPLQQQLLMPLKISVSADVEHEEETWIGYLRNMGYDIEPFGNRMYLVRALPAFCDAEEGENFLREFLMGLEHGPDLHSFASLDRLIMRSCKSAVKGGDALHPEEIQALLTQLAACDNPWSCPHGRPTIVRMTRGELERMFKR